jgi:agmatinase
MQRYNANLPSVGLSTFMKSPVCEDLTRVEADVAVLGIPYDGGTGFRPGSRFGPREIRSNSTREHCRLRRCRRRLLRHRP